MFLTAPTVTYADRNGRFWRNIPGLSSVVYRIDAQPGNVATHTLVYAVEHFGLVALPEGK